MGLMIAGIQSNVHRTVELCPFPAPTPPCEHDTFSLESRSCTLLGLPYPSQAPFIHIHIPMDPSTFTRRGNVEPILGDHLDPPPQSENTSGLETVRLFKSCDNLFRKLLQAGNSDYRGAIVYEYKAFILWTDGFDVAKGNLETILLGSERLRRTVVRLFASIESTLQCV